MKKILICDCRETDCSLLCAELSKATDDVSAKLAFSLKDLKAAVSVSSPDVVLCGSEFCGISASELPNAVPLLSDVPTIYIIGDTNIDISELRRECDVILTPINVSELLLRIKLRSQDSEKRNVFTNGGLAIDHELCRVTVKDAEIHLTLFEYKLLCILAGNCGRVTRYGDVISELWENPVGSEVAALRVYVNALRKKLGRADNGESYIQTQMGIGYCMPKIN